MAADSTRIKKATKLFVFCLLLSMLCLSTRAQLNYGRIYGVVTDQSGSVIVGATVTVIDVERGVSRPLTTNGAGEYTAPSLIPGTYTVQAETAGFKLLQQTGITLGVGQDLRVDFTLQPGERTQTVTVTGEVPVVNTSDATLGATLENQPINDLPVNGRDYTTLLTYTPGIVPLPGGSTPAFTANGIRSAYVTWMFDGLYDVNQFVGDFPIAGGANSFDEATILPLDAIQEVNTIENPKAEYGWKPGFAVNVGLKSGTNDIHGTAYAFGRDQNMDARSPFLSPGLPKALDNLEQFGASVGGPIKKDRLFYFGDYEGQRATVGVPKLQQIPTTASGAGPSFSFPDAIKDIETKHPTVPLSPLSLNLAGCTSAGVCDAANGVFGNAGTSATDATAFNDVGGSNNFIAKLDYHLNDRNALNGEYFLGNGTLDQASGIQHYWDSAWPTRAQVVRGVWIWTPNSNWVNEARFGYDRENLAEFPAECTQQLGQPNYTTAFGFVSGVATYPPECGFPSLTISTFAGLGGSTGTLDVVATPQISDSVSYSHGKHAFKFGTEIQLTSAWGRSHNTNATGTLTFGSVAAFTGATNLEDFLAGVPATGQLLLGNSTARHYKKPEYAVFFQDDWRLTRNLTVNLGLRAEFEPAITEQNDKLGNFDASTPSGLAQVGQQISQPYNGAYDLSPHVGIAWDVTGKGTTTVRLGGNIMSNNMIFNNIITTVSPNGPGAALNAIPTGYTIYAANGSIVPNTGNITVGNVSLTSGQLSWAVNAPIFNTGVSALTCGNGLGQVNPLVAIGAANPANPAPCGIGAMDPNIGLGHVGTWTLGVQHAFTHNTSLNVTYVGNHAWHLSGQTDINQPIPGTKNGKTSPSNEAEQIRRPYYSQFPWLGTIDLFGPFEVSSYNGLQVQLIQRLSHGLSLSANYTYSHALDDDSSEIGTSLMDSTRPYLEYGNATSDAPHVFNAVVTYNLPSKRSPAQLLEGWQINSKINYMVGLPLNAADSSDDISGTGELHDRWTIVGDPSDFAAHKLSPIPCYSGPTGSFLSSCTAGLPAACVAAAAAEPAGPGGTTGMTSLNSLGCYMEGNAVIVPPAQGTFGDMGRDLLRGDPFSEWDFSTTKDWKFKERLTAQFRAEFFNILNHRTFAAPASNPATPSTFGASQSAPNSGNPVIGTGGPRQVQLGLKLIF